MIRIESDSLSPSWFVASFALALLLWIPPLATALEWLSGWPLFSYSTPVLLVAGLAGVFLAGGVAINFRESRSLSMLVFDGSIPVLLLGPVVVWFLQFVMPMPSPVVQLLICAPLALAGLLSLQIRRTLKNHHSVVEIDGERREVRHTTQWTGGTNSTVEPFDAYSGIEVRPEKRTPHPSCWVVLVGPTPLNLELVSPEAALRRAESVSALTGLPIAQG